MESLFFLPLLSLSRLLTDSSFVTVPPSLLACACLSEAVSFVVPTQHRKCMERLSRLTSVEQVRSCNTWHCHWRPLPCPYVLLWRPLTKFLCNTCRYILHVQRFELHLIYIFSLFLTDYCRMCYCNTRRMCVMSLNRRSNRRAVRRRSRPHPLTLLTLKEQNSLTFQQHPDASNLGLCFFYLDFTFNPLPSTSSQICDPGLQLHLEYLQPLQLRALPLSPSPHLSLDFTCQIDSSRILPLSTLFNFCYTLILSWRPPRIY